MSCGFYDALLSKCLLSSQFSDLIVLLSEFVEFKLLLLHRRHSGLSIYSLQRKLWQDQSLLRVIGVLWCYEIISIIWVLQLYLRRLPLLQRE